MKETQNTTLVQQAYESIKRGDLETFLSSFAENIEWVVPEMDNVPFSGNWQGRKGVRQFFEKVQELQEFVEFEPEEFIAQGDKVVVLGRFTNRIKATGTRFSSKWAHVWTVKEGKIIHFYEYVDTAVVSRAYTSEAGEFRASAIN